MSAATRLRVAISRAFSRGRPSDAAIGPPIFPEAWSAGEVTRGDARQLKRAYHRAAARLHPDKVAELPVGAQALAEELFKALGEAYQTEVARIESGAT